MCAEGLFYLYVRVHGSFVYNIAFKIHVISNVNLKIYNMIFNIAHKETNTSYCRNPIDITKRHDCLLIVN